MTDTTFTIRRASADDASAIARLAALDSASPPTGELLLAEVEGELWAAVAIESGAVIADPFRPSGDLVELLHFRAARGCAASSASPHGGCASFLAQPDPDSRAPTWTRPQNGRVQR